MKKNAAPSKKTVHGFLIAGELAMAVAYVLFYLRVATLSLDVIPIILILFMGLAVLGGLGLNRVAPESGGRERFAAWTVALTPLVATWLFAAFRPPFGDAGAAMTAVDIVLVLIALSSLFGAWACFRAEEKNGLHLPAGAAWAGAGVLALAAFFAEIEVIFVLAMALAVGAQVMTVLAMRQENLVWEAQARLKPRA